MSRKIDSLSIRTATRLSATVAGLIAAGCGDVPTEVEPPQELDQAVSANPGSTQTVTTEPTNFTGANPEVMLSPHPNPGGCTGTVIGPYAVLSAAHCVFNEPIVWGAANTSLPVTLHHVNPYLSHQGPNVFTPDWWIALNNAQKAAPGGRQDDWPAQHDHDVMFVPTMTPAFLFSKGITPAHVAFPESVGTTNFRIVGVGSIGTTGATRAYMAAAFRSSIPNTITVAPRDGYLSRNTGANFAYADSGDSGGPTFWLAVQPWVNGTSYVAGKYIVGTAQNGGSGGDLAPLAYNPGITMTANQLLTARLNSMWIAASADDADDDGIPYDCDNNPALASSSHNNCPPALGGPLGANLTNKPIGLLQCRPGYVPAGLSGRFGSLIDKLSLRCVAYSCFDRPESCGDAYITDAFGGEGGGPLSQTCANDSVLVGAYGLGDSGFIYSLGSQCAPMARVRTNEVRSFTTQVTPVMGAGGQGGSFAIDCARRGADLRDSWLTGFQARTSDKRWVTGLHPICDELKHRAAPYVGGAGGGMTYQKCPVDHVAVGTVQRNEGGAVNVFGLICAIRSNVMAGDVHLDSELTLVRTSFADYATGIIVGPAVERVTAAHLPTGPNGTSRVNCSPGYAMTGVTVAYDGLIKRVVSFTCKDIRTGQSGTQTRTVNIGGSGGTVASSTCPFGGQVNGLYARSGWFADGVAMSCVD